MLRLYPTEKTEALIPGIMEVMDSWELLLVENLTPDEQEQLFKIPLEMDKYRSK